MLKKVQERECEKRNKQHWWYNHTLICGSSKLPELRQWVQLNSPPHWNHCWVALWPCVFPITWWEEWKLRGCIFSHYSTSHWQKSGESDPSARFRQGSCFSHHTLTFVFEPRCRHLWCSIFCKLMHFWFRINLFFSIILKCLCASASLAICNYMLMHL